MWLPWGCLVHRPATDMEQKNLVCSKLVQATTGEKSNPVAAVHISVWHNTLQKHKTRFSFEKESQNIDLCTH